MASPRQIRIASEFGLRNTKAIAAAADQVGIPFPAACALFEKESMGRNVYGHDQGGALSGFEKPVTKGGFAVFRWLVIEKGQLSNGVGPSQITYAGALRSDGTRDGGFFRLMDEQGLKPWVVADNMRFGLDLLWGYYRGSGDSWVTAGERYNGGHDYGVALAAKVREWQRRLAEPVPEPVDPPEPDPEPVPEPLPPATRLRVGTSNVGSANDVSVTADVGKLLDVVDVLCLQEMADRDQVLAGVLSLRADRCGVFAGADQPHQKATPILWNTETMTMVASGWRLLTPATLVGPDGAGPDLLRPKYANWVQLRHKASRRTVVVVNIHAVPTVEHDGQPSSRARFAARHGLYKAQMAGLTKLDAGDLGNKGPRVFAGDWNVNAAKDDGSVSWFPKASLAKLGMQSNWEALGSYGWPGTHGPRQIDGIFTSSPERVKPVVMRLIGTSSDHRALVVDYEVTHKE